MAQTGGRGSGPRQTGGNLVETHRVIALCRYELTLLRALCGDPEQPAAAELAVILAYIATRANGRSYEEAAVEPYLVGLASTPAALDRAAMLVVRRLDRMTLPAFRQAAIDLAAIADTHTAVTVAWEDTIERAIDALERQDAALLRERLASEYDTPAT